MENQTPQVLEIQADYDEVTEELYVSVSIINYDLIESIITQFYFEDSQDITIIDLNDDGLNGDIIPNDGVYSVQVLSEDFIFGKYQFDLTITDFYGKIYTFSEELQIEANYPPEIISVEIPETFHLDKSDWTNLDISVTVSDSNGVDDIKYVRYLINSDYLTKDDPSTEECDHYILDDQNENNYYGDPSWFMVESEIDSVFKTSIPMRPSAECGGYGPALFSFVVSDKQNLTESVSGFVIEIMSCSDGVCTEEFENCVSCPEDCGDCGE